MEYNLRVKLLASFRNQRRNAMSHNANLSPPASRFIRANGIRHHYLEWSYPDAEVAVAPLVLWTRFMNCTGDSNAQNHQGPLRQLHGRLRWYAALLLCARCLTTSIAWRSV